VGFAVIHPYESGHNYQLKLTACDGRTVAVARVSAEQIRPLGSRGIYHARAFEPAVR
jgi:hypothetical protein